MARPKTRTRPDPHEGLDFVAFADSLRDTFQLIVGYVHRGLLEEGFDDIRPAHLAVFQHLRPEGSRIGELARRCGVTNQSIGELVDHLERCDYVQRRPDPTNRRATLVTLTERGWSEMQTCADILGELDRKLSRALGQDRLQRTREQVITLQQTLQDLSATSH
jgi:MarR family transcriptional regulator, temperature-dependent positive regulator of motility